MDINTLRQQQQESQEVVNPKKFVLWTFLVAVVMLFAGLTSAFIVKKADGKGWVQFQLPDMFLYSTIVIILSSLTLYWAYRSARKDELTGVKGGIMATLILGLAFCLMQYAGYQDMMSRGLYFSGGSVSSSFVYVISVAHLLHIVGGLLYLSYGLVRAWQFQIHKKSMNLMGMLGTYWHFVGFLWVYLYLFLSNA